MIATLQHNIREMHATKQLPSFVQVLVTMEQARDDIVQLTGSKNALQAEIERLRKLGDNQQAEMDSMRMVLAETQKWNEERCAEIAQLKKIIDGTERREAEYLALVEKHATEVERLAVERNHIERQLHQCDVENEARRVQWEEAKREAEKWVHESGLKLGQAHKILHERNDEIARLRGNNTKLESENERLKAERHTTKRMLEDILEKHGVERPGRP